MKTQLLVVAILAVTMLATGCVERRVYVPTSQPVIASAPAVTPTGPVVVNQAPPPTQSEVIPPAPGYGYVWMPGHWEWNGGWVWVSGVWVAPPQPGVVWVTGGWVHHPHRGWVYERGHWRR